MEPYYLAKLVEWAGTLETRKRLQKVIYLLAASGCKQLDAGYTLHHYGPYSSEVANVSDQLVRSGILEETQTLNGIRVPQYSYALTSQGTQALRASEDGPLGQLLKSFGKFEQLAKQLLRKGMPELEYGATMVFFHKMTGDWETAVQNTCEFKKLERDNPACQAALRLAQEIEKNTAANGLN